MASEHKWLLKYSNIELKGIMDLPVARLATDKSHLYLWVPNVLLQESFKVMDVGGLNIKQSSFGTKSGKTANRMDVV